MLRIASERTSYAPTAPARLVWPATVPGGGDPPESQLLNYLSVGNQSIAEGNSGTSVMTFTVQLSQVMTQDVAFDYHTVDGTATAWVDYMGTSGIGIIRAGDLTMTIVVPIMGDTVTEGSETFSLMINDPRYL